MCAGFLIQIDFFWVFFHSLWFRSLLNSVYSFSTASECEIYITVLFSFNKLFIFPIFSQRWRLLAPPDSRRIWGWRHFIFLYSQRLCRPTPWPKLSDWTWCRNCGLKKLTTGRNATRICGKQVRYRNDPVPGLAARCRNADAGSIGLDADAKLCRILYGIFVTKDNAVVYCTVLYCTCLCVCTR
jgi:hypothetical protein